MLVEIGLEYSDRLLGVWGSVRRSNQEVTCSVYPTSDPRTRPRFPFNPTPARRPRNPFRHRTPISAMRIRNSAVRAGEC